MDMSLYVVASVALGLALVMAGLTWRVVRDDRRRAAARVAWLARHADSAADDYDEEIFTRDTEVGSVQATAAAATSVSAPAFQSEWSSPSSNSAASRGRMFDMDESLSMQAAPIPPALFDDARVTEGGGVRRLAAVIVLGALVASGFIAAVVTATIKSGAENTSTTAHRSTASAPLDLLSLRHTRTGDELTVTGLLHNPESGASLDGIIAVVFLFDRAGAFLASGRAPIDFMTLAPGADSPFVVKISNAGQVARYRVSFRRNEGEVVGHIDRRAPAATGRPAAPARAVVHANAVQ